MSLPDYLLEPEDDDEDYCTIHDGYLRPCRVCKVEALIERAEELYEQQPRPRREP